MTGPSTAEIVLALDHKTGGAVDEGASRVFRGNSFGSLLPQLIAAFPQIRNAHGRNMILYTMLRHARTEPSIVDLALHAASDPAYLVRMQACGILAYALDRRAIPTLTALLTHRDAKTREDAAAAIDAIGRGNHHLWVDRDGAGGYWVVNRSDDPNHQR